MFYQTILQHTGQEDGAGGWSYTIQVTLHWPKGVHKPLMYQCTAQDWQ
jgi:hypothetical protein